MNVLGIDLALTSSAFSILDENYNLIKYYYVVKKITNNDNPNNCFLLELDHPNHYINEIERFGQYISFIKEIFDKYNIDLISIEGLSNNSISSRKNEISALFYMLIRLLYINHKKVLIVSPKTMKKIITGNGNASKNDIINTIKNKYKIKIDEKIKRQKTISDIYDSIGFSIIGIEYEKIKNKNAYLKNNGIVLL